MNHKMAKRRFASEYLEFRSFHEASLRALRFATLFLARFNYLALRFILKRLCEAKPSFVSKNQFQIFYREPFLKFSPVFLVNKDTKPYNLKLEVSPCCCTCWFCCCCCKCSRSLAIIPSWPSETALGVPDALDPL